MSDHQQLPGRAAYKNFSSLTTRWNDNDVYGHLNNVIYFELFDTAINKFLIEHGILNLQHSNLIGLVVDNRCTYFSSLKFPDLLDIGIRITKLGRSSVTYEIGVFRHAEDVLAAIGTFVHVYVERSTNTPTPIPEFMRQVFASIKTSA